MTGQPEVPKEWPAETAAADAELEWLLCLASALQASQSPGDGEAGVPDETANRTR